MTSPNGSETLLVQRSEGIVTAILNRPHRKNACTVAMFDQLAELCREVRDRSSDRVLVLTGAGEAFCSGVDLGALSNHDTDVVRRASTAVMELYAMPKPTITALNGVAAGIGVGFALATDLVLAAESARLIMSFVKRALSPDGGTSWLLPMLAGLRKAKEIAFFGEPVTSAQAVEFGLVNRVLPDAELMAQAQEWAARLASGPATALATTKALFNDAQALTLAQAVEREYVAQRWNATTRDSREAIAAFTEKREPVFLRP